VAAPRRFRILFATPAYWPAVAFGGPIWMARPLTEGLTSLGHDVTVVTTSLLSVDEPPRTRLRTRLERVKGVPVHYLATPLRYRWMGVTPSLPLWLERQPRPDVVHVFGYRDPVTTLTALWCRLRRIPYVFEPLGMHAARFRNVPVKGAFDRLLGQSVSSGAAVVIANSQVERRELVADGIPAERIETRPNGFPVPRPTAPDGFLRRRLGLADSTPLVLSVGRISHKKGLDVLLPAFAAAGDGAHLAIVGPDDGDGTLEIVRRLVREHDLEARVHVMGPLDAGQPLGVYGSADVFVLPSRAESFGNVAAEAAAAGVPVLLTDRCGVAEYLRERAALVVPFDPDAIESGLRRLLGDHELRQRLGAGGREVAAEVSWETVVLQQEGLYRLALDRRA